MLYVRLRVRRAVTGVLLYVLRFVALLAVVLFLIYNKLQGDCHVIPMNVDPAPLYFIFRKEIHAIAEQF